MALSWSIAVRKGNDSYVLIIVFRSLRTWSGRSLCGRKLVSLSSANLRADCARVRGRNFRSLLTGCEPLIDPALRAKQERRFRRYVEVPMNTEFARSLRDAPRQDALGMLAFNDGAPLRDTAGSNGLVLCAVLQFVKEEHQPGGQHLLEERCGV